MSNNQRRKRKLWTPVEDQFLINYVQLHGHRQWEAVAFNSGLVNRDANSCWYRWTNYLRPDIQRGNFTAQEVNKIVEHQQKWGTSWSRIAQQLPGRTTNQIKNFWYTSVNRQAKMLNCVAEQNQQEMIQDGVDTGGSGSPVDVGAAVAEPLQFSEVLDNVANQYHYPVALVSDNCYHDLPDVKGFDDFCSFEGMM